MSFTDVTVFGVCVAPAAGEPAAGQQVQERSSEAGRLWAGDRGSRRPAGLVWYVTPTFTARTCGYAVQF